MSGQTSIKIQSEKENLLAKSFFYQLLSVLFRHPSLMDGLDSLKTNTSHWLGALEFLDGVRKKQLEGALELLMDEIKKTPRTEWIHQYENCFGHTAHGIVPSYELEYGEQQSLREPHQLSDIAAFYHAFGLKVNEKIHERVDHITVECEFMHFITYKEAYAIECGEAVARREENAAICKKASHRFLSEHLGRWAPSFALKLSRHAKNGLIKEIADFTFLFITQDCLTLGIEPGPSGLPVRLVQEKDEAGCVSCLTKDNTA